VGLTPTARASKQAYAWKFKSRFWRNAFGWRGSRLAAEGAVAFLERLSPALAQIDSSSGAIGSAVNGAIVDLVAIIADAPAEQRT
jgi:hypothetical protein